MHASKRGALDAANNNNEDTSVLTKEKDTKESTHAPKSSQEAGGGSSSLRPQQPSLLMDLSKPVAGSAAAGMNLSDGDSVEEQEEESLSQFVNGSN